MDKLFFLDFSDGFLLVISLTDIADMFSKTLKDLAATKFKNLGTTELLLQLTI